MVVKHLNKEIWPIYQVFTLFCPTPVYHNGSQYTSYNTKVLYNIIRNFTILDKKNNNIKEKNNNTT